MEMVLGLSRSEIDIEEIRKRICYILLACLSLVLPLRRKVLRM